MTRAELTAIVRADYHRYGWEQTPAAWAKALTLHPGFRYTVALRTCQFCAAAYAAILARIRAGSICPWST